MLIASARAPNRWGLGCWDSKLSRDPLRPRAVELNLGPDTVQSVQFSVASIVVHNTVGATILGVLGKTKAIPFHEEKTRRHRLEGPWQSQG